MAGIPKRILRLKQNRKKIRGFSRFWRDHQQRASLPQPFDLGYFAKVGRDAHKLGLYPWAVSEKPPQVIRQLWVARLTADFHSWHRKLAAHYADFYLAVWLYEPEFGRSQLVAGFEERAVWSETLFGELEKPPFPAEYQALPGVAGLHWTARPEITTLWPEEFAGPDTWEQRKPHRTTQLSTGETIIVVQIGWIWVGQATT
jgi:hypothetical protein